MKDEYFDIFIDMLSENIDELYDGSLHKGRFIGMYMDEIKELPIEDYERTHLKYPQFVSNDRDNRSNNWLDFVINLPESEFKHFKKGLLL